MVGDAVIDDDTEIEDALDNGMSSSEIMAPASSATGCGVDENFPFYACAFLYERFCIVYDNSYMFIICLCIIMGVVP